MVKGQTPGKGGELIGGTRTPTFSHILKFTRDRTRLTTTSNKHRGRYKENDNDTILLVVHGR